MTPSDQARIEALKGVLTYPPGSLVTLTDGEYSSYCIIGQLVTLREVHLPSLAAKFRAAFTGRVGQGDYWSEIDRAHFPGWLVAHGYCAPLDVSEVHVADFGGWD